MAVHARANDLAAINGPGTANQPLGILGTTGIGSVTMGANGGALTYPKLVDLETEVAVDNALRNRVGILTTTGVRGSLRKTLEFTSSGSLAVWRGGLDGEVIGYRAYATNQVPSNLTKGTSTTICHAAILGNFDDLIIGEWGIQEILIDPYTLADRNLVKIVSFQMVDVGLRHPESFAAIQDVLVS